MMEIITKIRTWGPEQKPLPTKFEISSDEANKDKVKIILEGKMVKVDKLEFRKAVENVTRE